MKVVYTFENGEDICKGTRSLKRARVGLVVLVGVLGVALLGAYT